MSQRIVLISVLAALSISTIAACGVPAGDATLEGIPDAEIPFNLADPSTTTTSTTTTTTTLPPATTLPNDAPAETSTVPAPLPEQVNVYFLSRGDLIPVAKPIRAGFTRNELVDLLETGPDEAASPLLESAIVPGLIGQVVVQDGVATVDLDASAYDRIRERDQLDAIAQIVLTLTDNRTRAGQVLFTFDGEENLVPTPGNFFKRLVSFDDYFPLIADAVIPEPIPTTTATTALDTTPDPETSETDPETSETSETTVPE
ncbi:MAG: GerMN domain-containing protein [Ilumatobacter sp.]|jgi:hypothetical protein|uniref:GerMN domain-containing protein n=1 Tax=Ilumatobacter sp. TaxID=1967498 RepID=UPI00391AE61A